MDRPSMPALSVNLQAVEPDADDSFARFVFGRPTDGARDFRVPLRCLDTAPRAEVWRYAGESQVDQAGDLRLVQCADYLLLATELPDRTTSMRRDARAIYRAILDTIAARGYPHIVKAWNYFSGMNRGTGDAERYKQFCLGRAEAFQALAPTMRPIPAGTAIGTRDGEPFTVVVLAARLAAQAVENPRQMSAYHYPREYAPRSPLFSRAALVRNARDGRLFISGTAAIVGHRSQHVDDAAAQTEETLSNLASLLQAVGQVQGVARAPSFRDPSCLRVYVRDPRLAAAARRRIEPLLTDPGQLVVLEGAICRRELQVEVDGVVNLETARSVVAPPSPA